MKRFLRVSSAFFMAWGLVATLTVAQAAVPEEVGEQLRAKMPHLDIKSVSESPVQGLYEVVFDGSRVVYVSEHVSHVFDGSLMELSSGKNMTRERTEQLQVSHYKEKGKEWISAMREFGADRYVNFSGAEGAELSGREMYVFTDITCPYCERFHQQVGELNSAGITVHYVLFARAGIESAVHQQHQAIWCSDDRQQALTQAKAGQAVEPKSCENPIDDHMELTRSLGVNATPTIFLDSGARVDGFRPAPDFIEMLRSNPAL